MYNHYTPQSDGSYQRSTRPDAARRPPAPQMNIPASAQPQSPPQNAAAPCREPQPCAPAPGPDLFSVLRGLLPRKIDGSDLVIVLLILLLNREDSCDGASPLLTLALYFLL